MTRSTSTQRGASRRNAGTTAPRGRKPSAATSRARSTKPATPKTSRAASSRRAAAPAASGVRVIVAVAIVALVWVLYPAIRLEYQASRHKAELLQERDAIARENDKAHAEVADLKTPEGVEKEARESLGYAKRGENVYVVVPPSSGSTTDPLGVEQADMNGRSIVTVLLDALFGVSKPSTTVEP